MFTISNQCLTLITMVNAFHLSLLSVLNPNHLNPDMKYSILIVAMLNSWKWTSAKKNYR